MSGIGAGLMATTAVNGEYRLYGVVGDVRIDVMHRSLQRETRSMTLSAHATADFDLRPVEGGATLGGAWRLTFNLSPQCVPAFPAELTRRTYDVALLEHWDSFEHSRRSSARPEEHRRAPRRPDRLLRGERRLLLRITPSGPWWRGSRQICPSGSWEKRSPRSMTVRRRLPARSADCSRCTKGRDWATVSPSQPARATTIRFSWNGSDGLSVRERPCVATWVFARRQRLRNSDAAPPGIPCQSRRPVRCHRHRARALLREERPAGHLDLPGSVLQGGYLPCRGDLRSPRGFQAALRSRPHLRRNPLSQYDRGELDPG